VRLFLICAISLISACDPGRIARFEVSPVPGPKADSALISEGLAIAQAVAELHQMTLLRADDDCPHGRYFVQDSVRGRSVGLSLCVRPSSPGIEFRVVELITSRWGRRGEVLRLALGDTLRAHFGDAAVRTK
jgi:hypothetical protein